MITLTAGPALAVSPPRPLMVKRFPLLPAVGEAVLGQLRRAGERCLRAGLPPHGPRSAARQGSRRRARRPLWHPSCSERAGIGCGDTDLAGCEVRRALRGPLPAFQPPSPRGG